MSGARLGTWALSSPMGIEPTTSPGTEACWLTAMISGLRRIVRMMAVMLRMSVETMRGEAASAYTLNWVLYSASVWPGQWR